MSAQHLFGTPDQQAVLGADVEGRIETVEDGIGPVFPILYSLAHCPSLITLSVALAC